MAEERLWRGENENDAAGGGSGCDSSQGGVYGLAGSTAQQWMAMYSVRRTLLRSGQSISYGVFWFAGNLEYLG